MKVDDKYLQRLGVLPYKTTRPSARRRMRDGMWRDELPDRVPWFSPAGFDRGINPIAVDPAENQLITWGQRTGRRMLNGQWTMETEGDLQVMHGIDAEDELAQIITEEIHRELERDPRAVQADHELDALVAGGELLRTVHIETDEQLVNEFGQPEHIDNNDFTTIRERVQQWMDLIRRNNDN